MYSMNNSLRRISISLRKTIIIGSAICIFFPSLFLGYFHITNILKDKINLLGKMPLQHYADVFSSGLEGPVWNMNNEEIKNQVAAILTISDMFSVTVVGQDREVLVSKKIKNAPLLSEHLLREDREITHNNEVIGHLTIELSLDRIYSDSRQDLIKQTIILFIQLMSTFVFIFIFSNKRILLPLRNLQESASRIAQGDLESPIISFRNDEIGELALVIDNMRKELAIGITELKVARETAEKASLIKSRFLDIAAHELRTPVTAFSLLIQISQKQLEKGFPVHGSVLTRLRAQADRISHLVVDLLDVSRLERGTVNLKLECNDLISIITECVADFKLAEPDRIVKIIKPETSVNFEFDSLRIAQVISNLLENSRKYTPDQSPIDIALETKNGLVRVSVTDHGIGISNEQLATLFTPFTRGSDDLTSRSGGLGLGLYICSEIIKLHGGTLSVISKIGEGSTFYFELPY